MCENFVWEQSFIWELKSDLFIEVAQCHSWYALMVKDKVHIQL